MEEPVLQDMLRAVMSPEMNKLPYIRLSLILQIYLEPISCCGTIFWYTATMYYSHWLIKG